MTAGRNTELLETLPSHRRSTENAEENPSRCFVSRTFSFLHPNIHFDEDSARLLFTLCIFQLGVYTILQLIFLLSGNVINSYCLWHFSLSDNAHGCGIQAEIWAVSPVWTMLTTGKQCPAESLWTLPREMNPTSVTRKEIMVILRKKQITSLFF